MSESKLERFKYGLLKAVDVSGFKVLDPLIRLIFREEPRKQSINILKFMITPIVFVLCCFWVWNVVAPRHKTNSGEVPKPAQVWDAAITNQILHTRENEKEEDFEISGQARLARIENLKGRLESATERSKQLKADLEDIQTQATLEQQKQLAPLTAKAEALKTANNEAQQSRASAAKTMSAQVASGKAQVDELLTLLRESNSLKESEKDAEQNLKDELKLLSEKPSVVQQAQVASNAAANEVQHLKKRLDYLTTGNRSVKVEKAVVTTTAALKKLDVAKTSAQILSAAKSVVSGEEKANRISEQSYPRRETIWFQVQRSLFTVFIGFIMAACVAIPVGIMCGLNKIVMACLTPIISIFKPVSPVVWLLIFQIVVGAFFLPDPNSYWLFEFCDALPFIKDLGVNPALIFSACTVAMCAVWPALVNTALGVSSIDQDHLNVARVLKLGLWARLFKIVIPSALPLVFAGLRISLGVGWMVLIAAEALSSSSGLGKYVWDEYQNGASQSFANIIFACFLVGIIGFFLDRLMILLQRSVSFDDGTAVV
ncbi:MAG: ABC transporter permease subunit [Fuerstiella sp.]